MKEKKYCQCCGASMNTHTHSLTKGIVNGLRKFAEKSGGKPLNLKHAELTRNEWDNFQKLKYWKLVVQTDGIKNGVWQVTDVGHQFLSGRINLHKKQVTYRGKVMKSDGDLITIKNVEVTPYFLHRDNYQEEMNGQKTFNEMIHMNP